MPDTPTPGSFDLIIPEVPPGTYMGVEVSHHPVLLCSEEEKAALKELARTVTQRDMPARREQVIEVWEHRLFDRGLQHLLPRRGGGWELPAVGSGYNPRDLQPRTLFEENIYNPYNQIIIGCLTREVPATRFESYDPDDPAGITAAENAEKMEQWIDKSNKMMSLLAEMARFLCTDGLAVFFTYYAKDAQRWGFESPELEEEEEETVPETEEQMSEEGENAESSPGMEESQAQPDGGGSESLGPGDTSKEPRGREIITVDGALNWKFPIKEDCLSQMTYAQHSHEIDLQTARAKYPDVASKISASSAGPGGDDIDRLARTNVLLGVFDQFVTTDSHVYDVTEQITWFRPAALFEAAPPSVRDSLLKKAGSIGLRVIFCGETFCECRQMSMDEQLTIVFAQPGDGIHRPGLTDWLIPIQKMLNNLMELANDYFVRGVPATFMDDEMFDVQKLNDQINMVGATYPFTREEGVAMDQAVWQPAAAQFPQYLWEMIQDLKTATAELLSGAFTALSGGGDTMATETYGGMLVQRDQALGRIGIPWRQIKEALSCVKRQAIMCLAHNHESSAVKFKREDEAVIIQLEDLKGNFLAFPKTEESFPESHTQIQNRLVALWTDAATNPTVGEFLYNADNLEVFLRTFGIKGFYLPQVASRDKQLGELVEILAGRPMQNPKVAQAQADLAKLQSQALAAVQAGRAPDPEQLQLSVSLQKMITTLPAMVSSVPTGKYDDHATEFQTCVKILNSPRGRKLRHGTPEEQEGFENLELHASEHEQAMMAKQQNQPKKPVSTSISLKDLPPKEAAQLANQAGIQSDPGDFQAEEMTEALAKHPGPGGITVQ